jgi:thiamine biosynthesis protein ThiS
MKLVINGDERELENGLTIATFLATKDLRPEMVVVEHNGEIVPRGEYASVTLSDGDKLEVVQMMAGG